MRQKIFAIGVCLLCAASVVAQKNDREYWVNTMLKISHPVLENLSNNTLRKNIPYEAPQSAYKINRILTTHMESVGRTFAGIAPWLELGPDNTPEGKLRKKYITMSIRAIANSVDPKSPDYYEEFHDRQLLVNAAFMVQGLLRAPKQLWGNLDDTTKKRVLRSLEITRRCKPGQNNWLLFSAMVEVGLKEFGGEWNYEIVKYALDKHKEWYKGDGVYGDGPNFHLDYYNSYVIQPMLLDMLTVLRKHGIDNDNFYDTELKRFTRYAEIQERMIAPDSTYPVVGRSMSYRFGAFQVLAQAAQQKLLPQTVSEGQVRSALTAVIKRQAEQPETFTKDGWLNIGFCGHQAEVGDVYITTACLYLCSTVFLPLGLPANDTFWTSPSAYWTSKKAFSGQTFGIDKALKEAK